MIFLELFLTFFMIGALTFGGGYAMLPMIQEAISSAMRAWSILWRSVSQRPGRLRGIWLPMWALR